MRETPHTECRDCKDSALHFFRRGAKDDGKAEIQKNFLFIFNSSTGGGAWVFRLRCHSKQDSIQDSGKPDGGAAGSLPQCI